MKHRFEMSDKGADTLLFVFSPTAILDLAERIGAIQRLSGSLPEMMQAPVRGAYTNTTLESESSANAESLAPSA